MATHEILEMLSDDLVSHGLVVQCLGLSETNSVEFHTRIKCVLTDILASGQVDIGNATLTSRDYVEFTAWTGTVNERVERALAAINSAHGPDKEFAYWLCLRQNVDHFE